MSYEAKVIAREGMSFDVLHPNGKIVRCLAHKSAAEAVCGDYVICQSQDSGQDVISQIKTRKNEVTRVDRFKKRKTLAANVDQLLIVVTHTPKYDLLLIDRYLSYAEIIGCKASLLFNKAEDYQKSIPCLRELESIYTPLGYPIYACSAKLGYGLSTVERNLFQTIDILVGQSGVGKSSLINTLFHQPFAKTSALTHAIEQGKHTTVNARIYRLAQGGEIIDSPGIRSFTPEIGSVEELKRSFIEFQKYEDYCQFNNCIHIDEPKCGVKKAVADGEIHTSRYANYKLILEELR